MAKDEDELAQLGEEMKTRLEIVSPKFKERIQMGSGREVAHEFVEHGWHLRNME